MRSTRRSISFGRKQHRRFRTLVSGATALVVAASTVLMATPALATPTVHEITANWAGDPLPTEAPYGQPVTAEWRINTNDATDPFSSEEVTNVRATLTAGNGAFASIPAICKTTDVTPLSEISADGSTLLCNIGAVKEGTSSLIQTPVRATGADGGDLTLSGTAASDSATAEAGPATPGPLPITYSHGMDLSLAAAPGVNYQGGYSPSRLGGDRFFVRMNFSLILNDGSRPGPESYSFPIAVSSNNPAAVADLNWESCRPISSTSRSTGQPYSDPAEADRTNFPGCAVSGSGANYTVALSDLDYTLTQVPTKDSLNGQPLPSGGAYIASGTIELSLPARPTGLVNYRFEANPPAFTFADGVVGADSDAANNASDTTLPPTGGFNNHWAGEGTAGRSAWDTSLWLSPGSSQDIELPDPNNDVTKAAPLWMALSNSMWNEYAGPGGAEMAGSCSLSQNPAFVPRWFDSGMWAGPQGNVQQMTTLRYYYSTETFDTRTETCGDPADWVEAFPAPGTVQGDPRRTDSSLIALPAGVTGVKVTWNPGVDRPMTGASYQYIRAYGHIDPAAPTTGEGWTVGTYKYLFPTTGYPTLNGWTNSSTRDGGADLPGSTYGPNMNGHRDAFRLQGPKGLISKVASDTTAQPGVPVTYTLTAQATTTVPNPPLTSLTVVDTLPDGMEYVPGSADPAPSSVVGQVLTWNFTDVTPNQERTITYQSQIAEDGSATPGSLLRNTAVVTVPGDNRPESARSANATVLVPSSSSTNLGKSTEDNLLSFFGDSSAWVLTIASEDPDPSAFTDTIDILPQVGDGRGTNIDGTYTVTGVTAPAGSTVYYTSADFDSLSGDARDASNGTAPGSIDGNTVGWSTTAISNPTAVRIIGPALAPGATQTIRIAYDTPEAESCKAPADGDNKPGQILVNSATTIAEHTELPMRSSATTTVGSCYAADLKKYVQDTAGVWHDANDIADAPQFRVGDTIRYRIVVENIGQGTLTNVAVNDDLQPELGSFVIESLARGETETHEYEIVLEPGGDDVVVNMACAAADLPSDGNPAVIECDPAAFIVIGDPTHTKTLNSATAIGNGQWDLRYSIDVENTSTHPTSYTLDDTLQFTDQATIVSAEVTASPAGVTLADPAWDGEADTRIAAAVPLLGTDGEGYAAHHYEVKVISEVPLQLEGAGSADDPTQCVDGEVDRAFTNTTTLTDSQGEVEEDRACAEIPSIDISKTISAGPTPNGDGTWTATYDIVATNAGAAEGLYTITDMMTAGGDLEVVSGQVITTPEGVTASTDWTGLGADQTSPENVIASDVALAASGTHTYQVEVILAVDATDGVPTIGTCVDGTADNGGLFNTAGIEHNDLNDDASACITVTHITVDKTVASGPTPNGDGTWTVVYDIVADNVGATAGEYDVYDQLRFGAGIEIESTDITAPEGVTVESDWTGLGADADAAENLVAADVTLGAGSTHTYSVEVVVSMDEESLDESSLRCPPPGSGDVGGLANGTTLDHNGIVVSDEVCPTLPQIEIVKSISDGPIENKDGTWTITYDLVATNIGAATGAYDLADDLNYGAGIVVESADVTVLPEGVVDPTGWTGQGDAGSAENVIATDVSIDAAEAHTYRVQVVVSLDLDTATPERLSCSPDGSAGLSNTAELTHNGETQSDEACANLPLIEITKSLSGAVVPVDGEQGVYDATYEITVTNRGLADGMYNLDDRLAVGTGVTVLGVQDVSTDAPDSVGLNPDFGTDDDVRIVTDQPIVAASIDAPVVHTYSVTVRYALDLSQIETSPTDSCTVEGPGAADGTLRNVAEVTWNGISDDDFECIVPGIPTLDKRIVSAEPVGDGQWKVIYDLIVGNTTTQSTKYDLDDEFLFAPVITVDSAEVAGPEGVDIDTAFDGADNQRIATDVAIAGIDDEGYTPHVYTVTVLVEVPLSFAEAEGDGTGSPACTTAPGSNFTKQGLNNAATLTDETGRKIVDTDCASLPSIDVAKSIVGTPVQDANGEWTVTYEIVTSNTGAAAGEYTLTDRLRFGAGIDITSAAVTVVPEGITAAASWTGQGDEGADENIVASGNLSVGDVHTYQVVVKATLDTAAADATTLTCPESGSDRGGFANTAGVEHNDLSDTADACDTPEWPEGTPPPLAITGGQISMGLVGGALLLLMAGGVFLALRRRRDAALNQQ